jgi:hypothetical protein
MYSKKAIIEVIVKNIQGLAIEKIEKDKNEKKTSTVNINNYSSNFSSTSGQFKKGNEAPIIKAVRKAIPQNPPQNINLSNKKKVSTKKDISTPIIVQNTPTSISSKSSSNTKDKIELKCNSIVNQIKSDISAVDPK